MARPVAETRRIGTDTLDRSLNLVRRVLLTGKRERIDVDANERRGRGHDGTWFQMKRRKGQCRDSRLANVQMAIPRSAKYHEWVDLVNVSP